MLQRDIERILKKNERYARILEEYDRTGKFPLEKTRRSFTLRRMTMDKLRSMSKKSGRSMSAIIDSVIEKA
jgi:hypothetical protein